MTRDELLAVYQAELPRLRSLIRKHLDYGSPDVEDILQDVFVQAWLHCDTLREDSRCAGWLMRIAANTCVTYMRRSQFSLSCDKLPERQTEDAYAPMMARIMLEDTIARLSPSAVRVVRMHDLEGYSLREVAHRMRKPESTVKSALYRARAMMRSQQLELYGVS